MYVTPNEVRAMAQGMTTSGSPSATDELVRDMIERVSRLFDLECGVEPEYFESALYPVWESTHVYVVGDVITPTTPNSHKYRVTAAGTSGSSEPTFPTGSGATVGSGSNPVFTEYGADVVATSRTFYGNGLSRLKLDPYVPGTLNAAITIPDGYTTPTFTESDGFLVLTNSDNSLAQPIYALPYSSGWWSGIPIIVSAKWGYATTPADVKLAIIEWVINVWRETDTASLKLVGLEGQVLRERIPPRVHEVVKRYRLNAAKAVFV